MWTPLCRREAALSLCWLMALACDASQLLEVTAQRMFAARRIQPFGEIAVLEAVRVSGVRPAVWATVGHVGLARVHGRVFHRRNNSGGFSAGFSAELILGGVEDARALAKDNGVAVCHIVRLPLAPVDCQARVKLPGGADSPPRLLLASGVSAYPSADDETVAVHFIYSAALDEASLNGLESRGEVTCQLRSAESAPWPSNTVWLRASRAVNWAPERAPPAAQSWPCQPATERPSDAVDLAAVYNFRSEWGAHNLAGSGRYRVTAMGGAKLALEGAELPGSSWLEIDTENGSLTERMTFNSRWSAFLMFRRDDAWTRSAALFSVHRARNRLACSIIARISGTAVYGRVHNLAAGFAVGQATRSALDSRPGAWNRVGIAYDGGGRFRMVVNGAVSRARARFTFPSYASSTPDGLRNALSLGLVRGPELALVGAVRCFGIARESLRPEQFGGLFSKYCQ